MNSHFIRIGLVSLFHFVTERNVNFSGKSFNKFHSKDKAQQIERTEIIFCCAFSLFEGNNRMTAYNVRYGRRINEGNNLWEEIHFKILDKDKIKRWLFVGQRTADANELFIACFSSLWDREEKGGSEREQKRGIFLLWLAYFQFQDIFISHSHRWASTQSYKMSKRNTRQMNQRKENEFNEKKRVEESRGRTTESKWTKRKRLSSNKQTNEKKTDDAHFHFAIHTLYFWFHSSAFSLVYPLRMVGLFFIPFSLALFVRLLCIESMCVLLLFFYDYLRAIFYLIALGLCRSLTTWRFYHCTHRSQWALHLLQWRNRYNHHGFWSLSLSSILWSFFLFPKEEKVSMCVYLSVVLWPFNAFVHW